MDIVRAIFEAAEELEAILLLEYHNKNHLLLATNPKRLNEEMRLLTQRIKLLTGALRS